MRPSLAVSLLLALAASSACAPPASHTQATLRSEEPASRLYAIQRAGSEQDRNAVPHLIDLLESSDPAERMLAIHALERITGRRLGYNPYAPPEERHTQAQAWARAYEAGELDPQ